MALVSDRAPYTPTTSDHARRERVVCDGPGFYETLLVKGGTPVGLRIVYEPTRDPDTGELLERSWYWSVYENGELTFGPSLTPSPRLYLGKPISEADYRFLVADHQWLLAHEPDAPGANPRQPINARAIKPVLP